MHAVPAGTAADPGQRAGVRAVETGGGQHGVQDRVDGRGLDVGQRVEIVRDGLPRAASEVTGIEKFRATLTTATAGESVGLLLRGVGKDDVQRGDVVQGG